MYYCGHNTIFKACYTAVCKFNCFLRFAWEAKTNSRSARHATLLRDDRKRMLLKEGTRNEERGTRNEERGTGNSERENEKWEII